MSTVEELRRKFAEGGGVTGGPPPGGTKPPPPRKPRPNSALFGNSNGSNPTSHHTNGSNTTSSYNSTATRNLNNTSNHQGYNRRESYDACDNGLPLPDPPAQQAAPVPVPRIQQPSFPPPAPAQRQQPMPPRIFSDSSWGSPPILPPPVPQTPRPESASMPVDLPTTSTRPTSNSTITSTRPSASLSLLGNSTTSVEYTTAGKGVNYELCTDLLHTFEENEPVFERSGTSRIGFGTDLQDKTAHEAILRLNDHELKLMDTLKKVIQQKIKSDREYSNNLASIGKLSAQFSADTNITHSSPLVKSWTSFIKETDNLSKLIKQHAEEMNNSLIEKLSQLIREKTEAKRQYQHERTRIDLEFQKAKDEVKDNLNKYQKCAKETKEAKMKYEEFQAKGRSPKDLEKTKDRYKKSVIKLHKSHNDYVLSLRAASLHQDHYRTSILPRLLECMQQTQESQVAQIKQILVDLSNMSNTSVGEFVTSHNNIMRGVSEIRPDQEYLDFVTSNKCEVQPMETFEFDPSPMQEFSGNLEENDVVLDKLTLEPLQHLHSDLETALQEVEQKHKEKKVELQGLDEDIRSIQPGTSEEGVLDLLSKQKRYRDLSRVIQELRCQEAKIRVQHQMLDIKISMIDDENELADGIELLEPQISTLSRKSPSVSHLDTSSVEDKTKTKNKRLPNTLKKMFATTAKHEEATRDLPLDEEEWYHGALPRTEAEVRLVNDGDFLVREKSDASGQIVLSAKAEGRIRHFPIQRNSDNMYRLEGEAFHTVGELIRHQLSTAQPVTKASQAVLHNAVRRVRDEHDMRHEEIELGDKLGQGHFGDVFRGIRLKDNTPVAVKTCKETVDASTRRKFLKEANILKQYNHANIVKLIGVCTDKHPIYIVMELVPGGDLLTFLRKDQTELSPKQMVKMGEDAAAGMAYLESKNCIHRDLAARNCLVGHKNIIKISDFGMSRQEELYTIEHGTMRQIPIKWTAPEAMNFGTYTTMSDVWSFGILLWEVFSRGSTPYPGMNNNEAREKVDQSQYTTQSDVWSFGILLWELSSYGSTPYPGLNNHEAKAQIDKGYRMPAPSGCIPDLYDLMLHCWKYEPTQRPKFKEIHLTLKSIHKKIK